ncbi:MAG: KamA family radical SAM protein [Lentisphaerae bacterium]|nr:KamA family radical SAM protein [Lentisphaerota bacterium]
MANTDSLKRPRVRSRIRFMDAAALRGWLDAVRATPAWADWKWQMRHALDAADLARLGLLAHPDSAAAAIRYPARVSPYYLAAGDFTDPADPLRAQWIPDAGEMAAAAGYCADPFEEVTHSPVPGLVHRFSDRVLVLASARCAVNCRHCTRKNDFENRAVMTDAAGLRAAVAYVRANPGVREVILSGGDPLLERDAAVLRRVRAFAELAQLDAVRIGTRTPATLPMRITDALARALGASKKVWVNTQFNHAGELTAEAAEACGRLVDAGIPVSNQAVLLKGVNDSVEALARLCTGLQRIRVRPYYVFIGDPVAGTVHFRVTAQQAVEMADALARRIGGLAMPRFVADIPGAPAKTAVQDLVR